MIPFSASMEPPSFDGGNQCHSNDADWECACASMEPPSFDGGNGGSTPTAEQPESASMEPPSFDGGNWTSSEQGMNPPSPLQWSRRLSTAETGFEIEGQYNDFLASMEPPSFDGGNSTSSSAESLSCPHRFNGAAVFRRRKLQYEYPDIAEFIRLQWSRRLSTAETGIALTKALNDALVLQWSRRLSTAETISRGGGRYYAYSASMEPPSFDGGNPTSAER